MQVTITADGQDAAELRALYARLVAEEELRGMVRWVAPRPEPGTLGALADALLVALAPGGVTAVLAGVLISYIRRPGGRASLTVRRPDGAMAQLTAERIRELDGAAVQALTAELARALQQEEPMPAQLAAPATDGTTVRGD